MAGSNILLGSFLAAGLPTLVGARPQEGDEAAGPRRAIGYTMMRGCDFPGVSVLDPGPLSWEEAFEEGWDVKWEFRGLWALEMLGNSQRDDS